jgi:spermidine/putrescine transport system ATP-binding protein
MAVGAHVEAFVRPEAATLERDESLLPQNQAHYVGKVQALLFDGANSAVLLQEDLTRFEFRVALPQTGRFADLKVGEKIFFSFDPQRAICFSAHGGHHG